jgi:hypothetical protein
MSNWHGGKGSKPRPVSDKKKFDDNWDAIFNKNKDDSKTKEEVKDGNSSSEKMCLQRYSCGKIPR